MTIAAQTEERLRAWLDGNQPQRERLCIAVLSLQKGFFNVHPRRPKGGPDGGRDIEATFEGRFRALGAVGFRNSAKDTPDDKKWVKEKFEGDLTAARAACPGLWVFVFFTNVDLTPSESDELVHMAYEHGIRKVEVFYRERLRICLDSPEGLAFRYQYLGIELSPAEQATFFEKFGQQLEQLIIREFDSVEQRLQRLEFLHEAQKPLTSLRLIAELKKPLVSEELGHFRMMVCITDLSIRPEHPTLCLAGRDAYSTLRKNGQESKLYGYRQLGWALNPKEQLQGTTIGALDRATERILATTGIHGRGPFKMLADLERKSLAMYLTAPLTEHIQSIALLGNSYVLFWAPAEELLFENRSPLVDWPEQLDTAELEVTWREVRLVGPDPTSDHPLNRQRPISLDFEHRTPQKVVFEGVF